MMLKPWLLRLHRWTTLVFALPILVLVVTGLILSFEPIATTTAIQPAALTPQKIDRLLGEHDPQGKARSLAYRPYDNALAVGGVGKGSIQIDLGTGKATGGPGFVATLFSTSRGLHEHLIYDLDWLVTASTFAMLALAALGVAMGWPLRFGMSLSGWHKATGWALLPLTILSPLTGLLIAYGITFADQPRPPGGLPTLREAVVIVGQTHDVSRLISLRPRGQGLMARIVEDGEYRAYTVTKDGMTRLQRNWPRLIHEGNWGGVWSGALNAFTSIAMLLLLATGLIIWKRRAFRKKPTGRSRKRAAQPA